jgi:hypothetical protein
MVTQTESVSGDRFEQQLTNRIRDGLFGEQLQVGKQVFQGRQVDLARCRKECLEGGNIIFCILTCGPCVE